MLSASRNVYQNKACNKIFETYYNLVSSQFSSNYIGDQT